MSGAQNRAVLKTGGGDVAALDNERGKRVALEGAEQNLIVLSKACEWKI